LLTGAYFISQLDKDMKGRYGMGEPDAKSALIPEPEYRKVVMQASELQGKVELKDREINRLRSALSKAKKANPDTESTQSNEMQAPKGGEGQVSSAPQAAATPAPTGTTAEASTSAATGKKHPKTWVPNLCPTCDDDADAVYEGRPKDEVECANCGQHLGPAEWIKNGTIKRCFTCGSKGKAVPIKKPVEPLRI
jgi:DNA-directed RNA polymerase subunit M/transcription elongation factor TFIIS